MKNSYISAALMLAAPLLAAHAALSQDEAIPKPKAPTAPTRTAPAARHARTGSAAAPAGTGLEATMNSIVSMLRTNAPRGVVASTSGSRSVTEFSWTNVKATGCTLDFTKNYKSIPGGSSVTMSYLINHLNLNLGDAMPLSGDPSYSLGPPDISKPEFLDRPASTAVYSYELRFSADQPRNGISSARDADETIDTKQNTEPIRSTFLTLQSSEQATRLRDAINRAINLCQNRPVAARPTSLTAPQAPVYPALTQHVWLTEAAGMSLFGLKLGMTANDMEKAYPEKAFRGGSKMSSIYGPYIQARTLPEPTTKGLLGIRRAELLEADLYLSGPDKDSYRLWSIDVNFWTPPKEGEHKTNEEDSAEALLIYRGQVRELSNVYTVKRESYETAKWPFDCPNGGEAAQNRIASLRAATKRGLDVMDPSTGNYLGRHEIQMLAQHCDAIHRMETIYEISPRVELQVYVDASQFGGETGTVVESLIDLPMAEAAEASWKKRKKALNP